jgi:hypothetical protein
LNGAANSSEYVALNDVEGSGHGQIRGSIPSFRIYFQLFTVHHTTVSRLKFKSILKFHTALHVSAYLAMKKCIEIRGNFCAFCATTIRVFVFTVFLNKAM